MKQGLFIQSYGAFVGYSNGNIIVRRKELISEQFPISTLSHVILQGEGVSISNAAMIECADKGVPIFVFDGIGRVRAVVNSPAVHKDHQLEMLQHVFVKSTRATDCIVRYLQLKEQHQRDVLHYHWRSLQRTKTKATFLEPQNKNGTAVDIRPSAYAGLQDISLDQVREQLFLHEARSARSYWKQVQRLLPDILQFHGRIKKHAQDPVNKLLNYGYALLSGIVLRQILVVGLDPGIGLLHHREGAAYPLVYDLMEPFRPLVDHAVFAFIHRQRRQLQDRQGNLRWVVLRRFRGHWQKSMQRPEPWSRRKVPLEILVKNLVCDFKTTLETVAKLPKLSLRGLRPRSEDEAISRYIGS